MKTKTKILSDKKEVPEHMLKMRPVFEKTCQLLLGIIDKNIYQRKKTTNSDDFEVVLNLITSVVMSVLANSPFVEWINKDKDAFKSAESKKEFLKLLINDLTVQIQKKWSVILEEIIIDGLVH